MLPILLNRSQADSAVNHTAPAWSKRFLRKIGRRGLVTNTDGGTKKSATSNRDKPSYISFFSHDQIITSHFPRCVLTWRRWTKSFPRSSSSRANYVNGVYSCNGMNELRINTGDRTWRGGGLILYGVSISWFDLTTCQFLCSWFGQISKKRLVVVVCYACCAFTLDIRNHRKGVFLVWIVEDLSKKRSNNCQVLTSSTCDRDVRLCLKGGT